MTSQRFTNIFKNSRTNWKYILIVAILAIIVGGGILTYQHWWLPREGVTSREEATVDEEKLAEDAVRSYVNALMSRMRDNVLSYLTGEAKEQVQKWPVSFGTTNPHLGSFKILTSKKLNVTEFEFIVREYQEYTGEGIIGYNDEVLIVVKIDDEYLISSIETGEYVDISWKTYRNEELGISFRYPPDWTSAYNTLKVYFWVRADDISNLPEICEFGLCEPVVEETKRKINDRTIDGFIEFTGGKGFIKKGCTVEGAPPLSPWYQLNFIKGNNWIYFYVVDHKTVWPITSNRAENEKSVEACSAYINEITLPYKVADERYKVYNDFLKIIQEYETKK